MNAFIQYFKDIFNAINSLQKGMRVTGRYSISPWKVVTEQYPENRKTLKMQERFKGEVIMIHTPENTHRCNGCGICQNACPNGTINIVTDMIDKEDGKKERIILRHEYNLSMCTFCGLCVKSCPSNALDFSQHFEHAVFTRGKLQKVLNQPGSVIKKEPKKAAPAAE